MIAFHEDSHVALMSVCMAKCDGGRVMSFGWLGRMARIRPALFAGAVLVALLILIPSLTPTIRIGAKNGDAIQVTKTYPNGDTYIGELKDGKQNGRGTFIAANGMKYVGELKDDKFEGQGTLEFADGVKYTGQFRNDHASGQGTKTFLKGDQYVGEFKDDKPNGQGTLTYVSGTKYVGAFKDGRISGKGTLEAVNGDRYVGEFKDDQPSGQGTHAFANGSKYVGSWKDGVFDGQGTFTGFTGASLAGEFKKGLLSGQGSVTYADGEKYVGEFKNGEPNGQGTKVFPNGDRYVGEFKDSKRNGQGTLTRADGSIISGTWAVGKFVGLGVVAESATDDAEQAWGATKDTGDPEVLEAFIRRYRHSSYANLARIRLIELQYPVRATPSTDATISVPPSPARDTSAQDKASAQRVVLYDEDPNDPKGQQYAGSVVWRSTPFRAAAGGPDDIAIRADVEIPERKLQMTLVLRRNRDSALPASHVIELTFSVPSDFAGVGIDKVPGLLMKSDQLARGTPLSSLSVKIADKSFLIGLSNRSEDRADNLALLRRDAWMDIPVIYTNQRRAVIAIEKGASGNAILETALAAWGQNP